MLHIRLGRLVLRTHRSHVMWLPSGYVELLTVYLVERIDEHDGSAYQLGGFTTEAEATACIARLESEGQLGLYINTVTVHHRLTDWHWNR